MPTRIGFPDVSSFCKAVSTALIGSLQSFGGFADDVFLFCGRDLSAWFDQLRMALRDP